MPTTFLRCRWSRLIIVSSAAQRIRRILRAYSHFTDEKTLKICQIHLSSSLTEDLSEASVRDLLKKRAENESVLNILLFDHLLLLLRLTRAARVYFSTCTTTNEKSKENVERHLEGQKTDLPVASITASHSSD